MLTEDGICAWPLRQDHFAPNCPALFLDRDGVIVEEVNYLHRVEDVSLLPGAAELVSAANTRDIPVVVVTNQAGIGRGRYGWPEFVAVQETIVRELGDRRATLDAVFACPFHRDAQPPHDVDDHPDRKPNPGMFRRAAKMLDLDLTGSWMVGDTVADVEAAHRAGLAGAVHVLSGHGMRDRAEIGRLALPDFQLICVEDLCELPEMLPLFDSARD